MIAVVDARNLVRPLMKNELSRINHNQLKLMETIDSKSILASLNDEGTLSKWQRQSIREDGKSYERNRLLLDIFTRKSYADLERLVHWLETTGQMRAVKLITEDGGKKFVDIFKFLIMA